MEAIKRQIFVLRDTLKDVIDYNIGTDMVPIEYHVMDFAVPETAAAVVYVLKSNGELDKILADILENVIFFCPTKGFFTEGLNAIQIRIVDDNKALVSFTETVRAGKNIRFDDNTEAQQKTLIEQLLTKIGEFNVDVKNERAERKKEIDVERQRINNLTKLQEGSTTGDAELADIRVGVDGKTYSNAGGAVRGQIGALKSDLKILDDDIYPKITPVWNKGAISGETGEEWGNSVSKYARTNNINIIHALVKVPDDFTFLVHYYNPTGWIGSSVPQKGTFYISSLSFYKTASYFRVSVESKNDIILSNLNNVVRIQDVVKSYKKRIEKLEMDTEFNKNYTFEKVILNATAPPSTIHVEHDIDARYKYAICPTKLFKGRSILMYAFVNGEYKRINAVNVNTGKKVNAIYQIGEYMLLGTENATKIKISSDFTCNASKTVTVSLKKYATTPYVPCEVKTTKYIPNYDKTEETVNLPYCFGTYNGYAYGISGTEIKRANLITKEIETFYTTGGKISSAMIFENGNIVFVRSDDYYSYLLKEGEVTRIHKFYDITNSMPLLPNKLFSMKATNNIGIISEYSGSKTPISGYKAYITKDYGVTWDILFDLEKLIDEPNLREYHLHSIVYDKFGDMYWACSGDETNIDMIWYSLDGVKWNKANNLITSKVTTIIPMRDCVIFISDTEFVNTFKWERTLLNNGDKIYFDLVSEKVKLWPSPCPIGCNGAYDEKNNVSYYGYFVDADINNAYKADHPIKYGVIYGTDGVRDIEVYTPNNIGGIIGIFCEDKKIIAAKTGNIYIFNK